MDNSMAIHTLVGLFLVASLSVAPAAEAGPSDHLRGIGSAPALATQLPQLLTEHDSWIAERLTAEQVDLILTAADDLPPERISAFLDVLEEEFLSDPTLKATENCFAAYFYYYFGYAYVNPQNAVQTAFDYDRTTGTANSEATYDNTLSASSYAFWAPHYTLKAYQQPTTSEQMRYANMANENAVISYFYAYYALIGAQKGCDDANIHACETVTHLTNSMVNLSTGYPYGLNCAAGY